MDGLLTRGNILCFTTLLITACQCGDIKLVGAQNQKCGDKCYTGNTWQMDKGECKSGVWTCYDDGGMACVGSVLPSESKCDGLDHDCDGILDQEVKLCTSTCGQAGTIRCVAGEWGICSGREPSPEKCDGIDNDCNGLVDDVAYQNPFCYDGPQDTVANGECRPGFFKCINGSTQCVGQILPSEEICDLKDNDCNGLIDDVNPDPVDVVICVDQSASMSVYIDNVKIATQNWANKFNSSKFRFALESCPDDKAADDMQVKLNLNFSDAHTFNTELAKLHDGSTGFEPNIDAVYMSIEPSNPLGLQWRIGVRRAVIVFSDETAQSYKYPPISAHATGVLAMTEGVGIYVFTNPAQNVSFNPMTDLSRIYNIGSSTSQLEAYLDSIILGCQ